MVSEKELLPQLYIADSVEWDYFWGMFEGELDHLCKKVQRSFKENTTVLSSMVQIHIQLHFIKCCLGKSIWNFGMYLEENMASNMEINP